MKIVQEKVDGEDYIEITLTQSDRKYLNDFMILSKMIYIKSEEVQVSVKLGIYDDDDESD